MKIRMIETKQSRAGHREKVQRPRGFRWRSLTVKIPKSKKVARIIDNHEEVGAAEPQQNFGF